MFFLLYEQTLYNAKILRLQAFPRESKDKDMAAMLVVLTIDANEEPLLKYHEHAAMTYVQSKNRNKSFLCYYALGL